MASLWPIAVAVRLVLFFLVFAFLALLKFLSLLLVLLVHLLRLLLLASLELVLALLICVLAAEPLLFLVLPLLHFLALGILLTLHLVELLFVLLLQPGIGGRIVGMASRSRATEVATVIFAPRAWAIGRVAVAVVNASALTIRFTRIWRAVSVVAFATVVKSVIITATAVIGSAVLDIAATELAWAGSRSNIGAAMIDGSAEVAISASSFKVMVLL